MHRIALGGTLGRLRSTAVILVAIILIVGLTACTGGGGAEPVVTTPPASSGTPDATPAIEETASAGAVSAAEEEILTLGLSQPASWGEINSLLANGARLLNCDTRADFGKERVRDSSNVPLKDFDSVSSTWKKDDVIILTSLVDATSRSGAGHLTRAGFQLVYYLEGGHDAWKGTFEGSAARHATVPPKVIYLFSTDPSNSVLTGNVTIEELVDHQLALEKELNQLGKDFPDIDITSFNRYTDASGHDAAYEEYDVPTPVIEGIAMMTWPRWVFVDSDGRIEHLFGMTAINTQRIYSFCAEESAK